MTGIRAIKLICAFSILAGCSARLPWAKISSIPSTIRQAPLGTSSSKPCENNFPIILPSVRGGGVLESINDMLSTDAVTNLFASMALVNGLVVGAAPDVAFKLYGSSLEKDSLGGLFAEIIGSVNIGTALAVTLVGQQSLSRVVGMSLVPRVLVGIKSIANGRLSKYGLENKTNFFIGKIVTAAAVASSLLLEKGFPKTIIKMISILEMSVGLLMNFFPETLAKNGDIDLALEENSQAKGLFRKLGQDILSHGVYIGCLVSELEPVKALGYTAMSVAVNQILTVVTKGNKELEMPAKPFYGYAFLLGGMAARLLAAAEGEGDE